MPRSPLQGPYEYGDTYTVTSSNTAASLASNKYSRVPSVGGSEVAQYCLVQPTVYGIKWCIGSTPVIGGLGFDATAGSVIVLVGQYAIQNFKYINKVSGDHAVLMVTMGF